MVTLNVDLDFIVQYYFFQETQCELLFTVLKEPVSEIGFFDFWMLIRPWRP